MNVTYSQKGFLKTVPSSVKKRAREIKLLAMDVDGVLTGGEIIILNSGEEIKIWSVKDRMGFALLKHSGLPIKLAWLTARKSLQVKKRAEEIGVHFLFQKCTDKWKNLMTCANQLKISSQQIAYIGDDFVDLKPIKNVGLAICPPDSPSLLKKYCHYQTRAPSGKGVVREAIEIILDAHGKWECTVAKFSVWLILAIGFALNSCSPKKTAANSSDRPDQWIEKFTITETVTGVPVWILNSEIAKIYNRDKKAVLENIRIHFMKSSPLKNKQTSESLERLKKNQKQSARLTAPKGEVKLDNHNLTAWGGVEVQAEDGTLLYTDRLNYSTDKQMIWSESPVRILRHNSILLGEGLEASPDLSTIRIFRHQASIYPKNILNK